MSTNVLRPPLPPFCWYMMRRPLLLFAVLIAVVVTTGSSSTVDAFLAVPAASRTGCTTRQSSSSSMLPSPIKGTAAAFSSRRRGGRTPLVLLSSTTTQQQEVRKDNAKETTILLQRQKLENLDKVTSGSQARRLLKDLKKDDNGSDDGGFSMYESIQIPAGASSRELSDGDFRIMTRFTNRKYDLLDLIETNGDRDADRASLAMLAVFMSSSIAAITSNQILLGIPEILRFMVVFALTFAPLVFIGYGIKDVTGLQTWLVQIQRNFFPSFRQRLIQHEAGHFLLGYLLGWPIQNYQVNTAVKNAVAFYPLNDDQVGVNRANDLGFDRPKQLPDNTDLWPLPVSLVDKRPGGYFSEDGRGRDLVEQSVFRKNEGNKKNYTNFLKVDTNLDATQSWPFRSLDDAALDQLTVISVAGACSEILAFGNAEGGVADFQQLRQLLSEYDDREVQNRIRYALGYSISQLRQHLGVLDALADVMERDGSIAECIWAIEQYGVDDKGQKEEYGIEYEKQRRQRFLSSSNVVENLFLGGNKNIDAEEDRYMEGKGGGDRKEGVVRLTGDDPFYLALGVAVGFLLWASSGGLSLH